MKVKRLTLLHRWLVISTSTFPKITGAEFNKKSYWISQNIAPLVRTVLLFRNYSEAFNAALEHFQTPGLSFGTERHHCWRDEGLDVLLASCRLAQLVLPFSSMIRVRLFNEARQHYGISAEYK